MGQSAWKTTDAVRAIPECSVLSVLTIYGSCQSLYEVVQIIGLQKKVFKATLKYVLSPWKFGQRPSGWN